MSGWRRGLEELEAMLGLVSVVRLAVWFGWPAVWLVAKVRIAMGDVALAGSGFIDVALTAGSGGAVFPAPWEVLGGVLAKAVDLGQALMIVVVG